MSLMLIGACSSRGDTEAIAHSIQADLEGQGDIRFEKVACPRAIEPIRHQTVYCWGKLGEDKFFPIEVQHRAALSDGNEAQAIEWRISTSRTLLNLAELERQFQDDLTQDIRVEIQPNAETPLPDPLIQQIDCGATYRENTPGDTFRCQVMSDIVIDKRRLETVKVTIDSQGNLNWQGVRTLLTPEELQAAESGGLAFESVATEPTESEDDLASFTKKSGVGARPNP
jgi:hypothetical protein